MNSNSGHVTTTVTTNNGETFNNPSALKGNVTSFVGAHTHNPQKELAGNAMVAGSKDAKAQRFENKAVQWEQKGNAAKAQKNREKAQRFRTAALVKLSQPAKATTATVAKQDKAARCEIKALEYERKGNVAKAQKNRERAMKIRQKNGLPASSYTTGTPGFVPVMTQQTTTTTML